jgi:hypothetical protein
VSVRGRAFHPRARPGVAIGAALAGVIVLTGCASTKVVGSAALRFSVEFPSGWKVFNKAYISQQGVLAPPLYIAIASDSPHPRAGDLDKATPYPWAVVEVNDLSAASGAQLSLESLNDQLFNVDQMASDGESVQELVPPQMVVKGSLRGISTSFAIPTVSGAIEDYKETSWVNSATNRVWIFAVGCSPSCFQADQFAINRVMGSFNVQDRGI